MNIDDRMDRWERRQEALIASVNGLTDVMVTTRDMLAELMQWLQKPPSSDLPDALKALTAAVEKQSGLILKLPAEVAKAVTTGEVR